MSPSTQALPVSGRSYSSTISGLPSSAVWGTVTITRRAPCTSSMAPPIPVTILPGMAQLVRSPLWDRLHAVVSASHDRVEGGVIR